MLPNKRLAKDCSSSLVLVAYVQEVVCQAVSQATSHILTHLHKAFQFFSPLIVLVLFTGHVRLCVSSNESFIIVACAQFTHFYLKSVFDGFLLRRLLSWRCHWIRHKVHNLFAVFLIYADAWVCACVRVRLTVCISVLFLKRYVGVFGAHGSSCCVPSYFPACVSTWLHVGCSPEIPPQPESRPGCPVPSGHFVSSGCS